MIDPSTGERQWNALVVAGQRSPGVVKLSGPGLVFAWDEAAAKGQEGATNTLGGAPLKKFDAEFELSDELDDLNVSDFDLWDEFQDLLLTSVVGKEAAALEVYHPDLARCQITAVTLAAIGMMSLTKGGGGKIKVSFTEHRPPKPKTSGGAAKVKAAKTEGDKQIDAAKAELDALQNEWKDMGDKPQPAIVMGDAL